MVLAVSVNACCIFLAVVNSEKCWTTYLYKRSWCAIPHRWKKKLTSAGKNFHIWEHDFRGSEATPCFPGFVIAVCVFKCVSILVWVTRIYFSFSTVATCRVNLLAWKEMQRIVCLETVHHTLTSCYFPFIYAVIMCCSPGSSFWNALCQTLAAFVNILAAKCALPCHLSDTYCKSQSIMMCLEKPLVPGK